MYVVPTTPLLVLPTARSRGRQVGGRRARIHLRPLCAGGDADHRVHAAGSRDVHAGSGSSTPEYLASQLVLRRRREI